VAERDLRTRLIRRARKVNLAIPDDPVDKLAAFLDLLLRWNRKINLTALTDADEAIDRLLLEPWLASRYLPDAAGRLIDIGSGGGSPAIPLALAHPAYGVTMVESKARKAAFLREAVRVLKLELVTVEQARFQGLLAEQTHLARYSAFSVRAVRIERATLTELAGFLSHGGLGLVFRGMTGADAVGNAPPLSWIATHPLLPNLNSRISVFRLDS
jgi:16S rRNA (guanine527-N7)-methyltransferase